MPFVGGAIRFQLSTRRERLLSCGDSLSWLALRTVPTAALRVATPGSLTFAGSLGRTRRSSRDVAFFVYGGDRNECVVVRIVDFVCICNPMIFV